VTKYDGLVELLRDHQGERIQLAFEQISTVVAGGLPPSAYQHRAWWANEPNGRHVQARAWMGAGWVVAEVHFAGRAVTFSRAARQQ
jgi:hypothetical protein